MKSEFYAIKFSSLVNNSELAINLLVAVEIWALLPKENHTYTIVTAHNQSGYITPHMKIE